MKNFRIFVVLGMLLFSCTEKEEPQTIYGDYLAQSITADRALDISGVGTVSVDLLSQFQSTTGGYLNNDSGSVIFLRLVSPEYYNTGFPQVLFNLPYQLQFENGFTIEYQLDGRRYNLADDGTFGLLWNTSSVPFDTPNQFRDNIFIESLTADKANKTVELVISQRLFDFSIGDWVDVEITYFLLKEN